MKLTALFLSAALALTGGAALAQTTYHNPAGVRAYDNVADANRVTCVDATGAAQSCGGTGGGGGAGTEFNEDAVHASGALGTLSLGVRQDTATSLAGTSGDYTAPIFDANGLQWSRIGAALPAGTNNIGDVDVLTLPALPAGTNNIGDVDVLTLPALPAGSNTIGSINNISGTVSLPTGASTAANQTATQGSKAPGTAATNSQLAGGVYNSTPPTLTTGQQAAVQLDSSGRVIMNCGAGCAGGTQFAEDAAHTSGDLGTQTLTVRTDTAAARATTDGDYQPLITDSAGRLHTNANQTMINGVAVLTGNGVTGTGSQRVTIASDQTAFTVNLGTIGSAATAANQVPGKAEDAVAASGDVGNFVLGIRADTAAATAAAGDYTPLLTDANGALWVRCNAGCSGGSQFAEDAAHTTGDIGTAAMAVRSDTAASLSGTTGDYNPLITDASGRLHVHPVLGDGDDNTQGAKADSACANGSSTCSVTALLKGLLTAAQDTTAVATNPTPSTSSACTPYGYQSAATTNSTNIKSSAGQLCGGQIINTTATLYYLRLYNASAAPTCSSATNFVATIPVPASTTGSGTQIDFGPFGAAFSTGISFCLTGGGTSTDNTNAAVGVFLSLGYK